MCMQYTLRNVPPALDEALRRRAREEGTSLNQTVLRALARAMGLGSGIERFRELGDLAGSWQEDPDFDRALADQHRVDDELWR